MKRENLEKMKKETQKKLKIIAEEEARIYHENFMDNVSEGVDQYEKSLFNYQSLTPLETILAKCAHCTYTQGMMKAEDWDCHDYDCPMYDFMCEKKYKGKAIEAYSKK